ncbi:glycosyltransferase family 4 protein [Flavobacterium sp. 3HN19-14]|uniref:glycosyltransferase family 4 protein n=1 Tax=Flavobacterium sp. 3HN19-14 TaxID=3448133 RepID=UPI003EE10DE9
MKKTLVDLIYVPFPIENRQEVAANFYSTLGFLEALSEDFDTYFLLRTTTPSDSFLHKNIKTGLIKGKPLKKWQVPFRFNSFVKSLHPDYVLAHGFAQAHYLMFLKLSSPQTKILLQANGFAPRPGKIKSLIYKIADRFIDGYLFTGVENAEQWYAPGILKKEKIFEVMEGATDFEFDHSLKRTENSFLWVGRLDENKDPLTILKAFLNFANQSPTAKLTMVFQEGHLLKVVENFIANHENLSKQVDLKGFVSHEGLRGIYHSHQYFVLGSHYEGSGYALAEAMGCGCVPIVTDIAPFQYMTHYGYCGLLFPPEDVAALTANFLATQTLDFRAKQHATLQQYQERMSAEAIAAKIKFVFESL